MGLNKVVDIGGSSRVFGFQREEGNVITCYLKFGQDPSVSEITHSGTENNVSH